MSKHAYLFIIRSYNDIDHMTPLIDRMASDDRYNVTLLSSNSLILLSDNENLSYLKRNYNLDAKYLLSDLKLPFLGRMANKLLGMIYFRTLEIVLPERLRWIVDKIISLLQRYIVYLQINSKETWAKNIVDEVKPNIVLFDMTYPGIFPNKPLIDAAKSNNIPVVALPHGLNIWTNIDHTLSDNKKRGSLHDGLDFAVSQGVLATKHLKVEGWPDDKIVEIGSMRFSKEWLEKCEKVFIRKTIKEKSSDKIKIVLFLSKGKYRANINELKMFITFIANEDDVQLIIKPHTRGMKLDSIKSILKKNNVIVAYSASSVELSKWCDIAVVYGSSIGLQILADNKILVYPSKLDENKSVFEKHAAACIVNNLKDMQALLDKYREGSETCCYTKESVNNLFEEIVYAGDLHRNVIEQQLDFLEKVVDGVV